MFSINSTESQKTCCNGARSAASTGESRSLRPYHHRRPRKRHYHKSRGEKSRNQVRSTEIKLPTKLTSTLYVDSLVSSNFEWLKQLRYYWNSGEEVVVAKMANAQYNYGYEYLGASPRLVITGNR